MFYKVVLILATFSLAAASETPTGHASQAYKFGYVIKNKHGKQHRQESGSRTSGVVASYDVTGAEDIKSQVNYVTDKAGFRDKVETSETGINTHHLAPVLMFSEVPYAGGASVLGRYGVMPDENLAVAGPTDFGRVGLGYSPLNGGLGLTDPIGYGRAGLGYGGYDLGAGFL